MTREQKAIIETTPGRMLLEEFLEPNGLSQSELARRTGIPRTTVNEIIKGKRPINAETALILGTFFAMDPQFWINLQSRYDLRRIMFEKEKLIRSRVQPFSLQLPKAHDLGQALVPESDWTALCHDDPE